MDWLNPKTLNVEYNYVSRKVREAIEIQANETGPDYEKGCNLDNGQYVATMAILTTGLRNMQLIMKAGVQNMKPFH